MSFAQKMAAKVKQKTEEMAKSQLDFFKQLKVSPEIQKERMDTCLACEKLYKPTSTCKVCGCFMQVKTWLPEVKCPIDKWPAVKVEEDKK